MEYKIKTDVFGSNRIIQELSSVDEYNHVTRLSRWVVDVKEKAIRDALIRLGWTPPRDNMEEQCQPEK